MYDNIYIPEANTLKAKSLAEEKEQFLKNRLAYQLKIIEERMRDGYNSARWIFAERDAYTNDLKNAWLREFDVVLAEMFEEKGYIFVDGIIQWL